MKHHTPTALAAFEANHGKTPTRAEQLRSTPGVSRALLVYVIFGASLTAALLAAWLL